MDASIAKEQSARVFYAVKIASWNVNSLRVRLPQVLDWLRAQQPDVLALQETKLVDEAFPQTEFVALGYTAAYCGQKTYNGVALLSKTPSVDVVKGMPRWPDDQQRYVAATVNGVRIVDLYVPNGESVGSDKYQYKLAWLAHLAGVLQEEITRYPRLVVVGDFNIAPDDRDVHDPIAWKGSVLCSEPERAALRQVMAVGLEDTFRWFEQPDKVFSWWDYRMAGFRRNLGLRIDLILASAELRAVCQTSAVDRAPRALERPSDHAPVVCEFRLPA